MRNYPNDERKPNRQNAYRLKLDAVLLDVYALAAQHYPMDHPHSEAVLNVMNEMSAKTARSLERLSELGLVKRVELGNWALTETGQTYVEQMMKDRFNAEV